MWEDEHASKAALENEVMRLQNEIQTMQDSHGEGNPRKRSRVE